MRDRLKAGRRVLAPLIKVRILVPQPNNLRACLKTDELDLRGYESISYNPFLSSLLIL